MTAYTHYASLENKCVFITGGATGIGAEMVRAYMQQGAKVGFVDIDQVAANKLLSELQSEHEQLLKTKAHTCYLPWFQSCDVAEVGSLNQAIQYFVEQYHTIHVLINNVANDQRMCTQDISETQWQQCLQVNLNSAFFAAQAVLPLMREKNSGVIINFSSINTFIAPEKMVGYNTAKAGIIGLTKSLANEYGQYNIRVNALTPGWVATEKQLQSWLTEEEEHKWTSQMAIKQRIYPEHVAKLALFLGADDSAMITGQSIAIDGGRL